MLVEKIFVQSNCLQGENIAAYLLWDKDRTLIIEVTLPQELELVNVNNAQVEVSGNKLVTKKIESNGYFGLVLKAARHDEHTLDADIKFTITDVEGRQDIEIRTVHLFRPEVQTNEMPDTIKIETDERGRTVPTRAIGIHNEGEGLAILGLEVDDDSEIEVMEPVEMKEFGENFGKELSANMDDVKKNYNSYTKEIDTFVTLMTTRLKINDENLKRLKKNTEDIENVLAADPKFSDVFISTLFNAFYKNFNIITEFESFVNYIKSIETSKIIIFDPISVIKAGKTKKRFKGQIKVLDRGLNIYPSIPFNILIEAESETSMPVYKLLVSDKQ